MSGLLKIDRPPAAEHWSRMQHPDVDRTAKKIFAFLRGGITWNYTPSRLVAKYYIEDGISRSTGLKLINERGNRNGRSYNLEVVNSFFDMVEETPIVGLRSFSELVEWFPIGPRIAVPIKPLSVTREEGCFVPNFFNPWSTIAFDSYQASLYMTILEKSLFRLTDFENSPGRIIFLPRQQVGPSEWRRRPVVWERGQFPLLTDKDLNEQVRIFVKSRDLAKVLYSDYLARKRHAT